jgi:RHS repeat-associated protein
VYNRKDGSCSYQITDHLGNVRAVVQKGNSQPISVTDYYPFGEQLAGRNTQSDYRYAFQGQELDKETGMEAFQLRLWDGRIGRWLSKDPKGQYSSPYLGMGNNPIGLTDPDGGWVINAIAAAVGGVVSGGVNFYNQGGFSGKKVDWSRVALAAGSGALAGATLNLGAAVAINTASDFGDQLIANGGNLSGVNITQLAVSGVSTYIGGKIGSALLSKNASPTFRNIIDKIHSRRSFYLGKEVFGNNKTLSEINNQALKLAVGLSEFTGGTASYATSKLVPKFNDDAVKKYIQDSQKQWFNLQSQFLKNQMFNYYDFPKGKNRVYPGPLTMTGFDVPEQ